MNNKKPNGTVNSETNAQTIAKGISGVTIKVRSTNKMQNDAKIRKFSRYRFEKTFDNSSFIGLVYDFKCTTYRSHSATQMPK